MATGSCGKFEANIFNKNKCQNCFKSREVHPLNDGELEQAKPVYAGWLCLAPVGTDFDNPMQRSRKWQRRFFILYEHGSLTYALDELSSTLPQGTVNMNLCTNVTDGESRTGQRNALCIVTPGQEMFIRSDNKEIINGWSEQLTVYLQTNKQNQKKKRKVDPVALQYPCPAKMAATGRSWPSMKAGSADVHHWGRELHAAGPDVTPAWTVTHKDPEWSPAGSGPSLSCPASDGAGRLGGLASSQDLAAAGRCNQLTDLIDAQKSANSQNQRRYGSLDRPAEELLRGEAAISRQGRPDAQSREKLLSAADSSQLSFPHPQRRAKSLDRRTSDTAMTPDVLTFKKGWMMKLDKDDEWKKHWFVLSTASLRYYKDSVAEESSDLEGEINLTKCYSVSEYEVQRNYGFQIHTQKAVYTLSAMTAGIRNNWIQSLKKYVNPANAPDVDSLPGRHITCRPPEVIPKPDVTHDSVPNNLSAIEDPAKPRNVTKIRHEGRSKIFDWFEFGSENQCTVDAALCSLEMGDSERWRRREERRRRYESLLGFSLQKPEGRAMQVQQTMAERIAECWRQVEKTPLRPERTVRLSAQGRDSLEMDNLLQGCREVVNDLKAQLADSERRRLQLEAHLSTARSFPEPDVPVLSKGVSHPADVNLTPLKDLNGSDVLQHQKDLPPEPSSLSPQLSSIWMHDIDKERDGLLFVAPTSDGQHDIFQGDGGIMGSSCDSHNHFQLPHNTEKIIFEQKKSEGRDDIFKNHVATDQSVMKRLSHEVELLTRQNQALNQRNQEMVNQLTEADREIEKLKVELGNRYTEPHHLPEVEQQENIKLEDLERQLILRSQELHEALMLISSLEGSLRDTEVLLQLKHAAETNTSGKGETKTNAEKTELLRCLDATEIKLTELKRQLEQSELTCRKLEHQNMELKEAEELYRPKATEAEANKKRMTEEKREEEERNQNIPAQEKIQQVVEGAVTRLQALRKLLELIDSLDLAEETEEEQQDENAAVLGQLRWEESFWKSVLNKLKNDPQQLKEPPVDPLYEVVKGLILEKQMMLAGHELLLHAEETSECGLEKCKRSASKDVNFIGEPEMAPGLETGGEEINCRSGINDQLKNLKAVTEKKISSLKLLAASSINSLGLDRLLPAADRLYSFYLSPHSSSISLIHSAATEAFCCCLSGRLQSKYQRRICPSCVALEEQNEMLQTRMSALEKLSSSEGAKISTGCQTDERAQQLTEAELQSSGGGDVEDMIDMEQNESGIPLRMQNTGLDGSDEEDSDMKTQRIFDLRAEVGELEEQPKLKEDFDEKMNCVQEQHEREIAKLKATWECGLVAMEDCHLRVVVELQHLHQQEVERLLVERERLLEEESAATATTIKAIKSAHRAELQREIQKRSRSENGNGNPQLEEIHREELASFEREFDVLSHQFSMKCLENTHLVQALDAERKALCQCQQENQDLRNRNQELSGHLAGEITRLCFLAKRDQLPPGQRMDAYETEIMLRMKESEVQCLKLGVASLKDELQAGVKDKTIATKNYKDVHGELSIIRAKAEQEAEELRENLRLTHQALGETST